MQLRDLLLGKPLRSCDAEHERVGVLRGVPLLGLDALSSAAYGPEALLTVLLPLGVAGLRYVVPLTLAIVALLTAVYLSYRQTIEAYPSGGGSYTVARDNLGRAPSLVAAAALVLDYLLNVAVAISAGVGALVSAVPALLGYTLPLCLAVLLLLVLVNLRGVRESGAAFALPTYAFVAALLAVIGVGIARAALAQEAAGAVAAPDGSPGGWASGSLLLRAFANGCTAMTGVEAVSNGVPNFREPATRYARRTLGAIVLLLVVFLLGIALLCRADQVVATAPGQPGYQSILSQLAQRAFGRGLVYAACMASIFAVLALSANTSFADFPRVARLLAGDCYLPEFFEHRGRRLVFSVGILVLAFLSALLLVVFGGVTDRLIPLFAVGALTAFTMSQAGMVVHWRRANVRGVRLWLNAIGAITTGATVILVLISKFLEGAWISVLTVLVLIALFASVRRHYEFVDRVTRPAAPLDVGARPPAVAVVPVRRWNAVTLKALRFALALAPEVVVVQILTGNREEDCLKERWEEIAVTPAERIGAPRPRLVVLRSEYRELFSPLLRYVRDLAAKHGEDQVAVVLPELVEARWYHALLHTHASAVLRALLLRHGGPNVVVVTMPWSLREWPSERQRVRSRRS